MTPTDPTDPTDPNEQIRIDIDKWMAGRLIQVLKDAVIRYQIAGVSHADSMTSIILALLKTAAVTLADRKIDPRDGGAFFTLLLEEAQQRERKRGKAPPSTQL